MPTFFYMPKLGLNMVEGTILNWMVKEGDEVKFGQPILEIETDKAAQEVEAPGDGRLAKITRQIGETVPCNTILAVILKTGEQMPAVIPDQIVEGVTPKASLVENTAVRSAFTSGSGGLPTGDQTRIPISPAAKTLANELGINIALVKPRGSRIMREDVEAAYKDLQNKPAGIQTFKKTAMSSIRRKISEHMNLSTKSVARVDLTIEADAGVFLEWKEKEKEKGNKYSYNVLFARLVAKALKQFPYMNSQIDGDSIREWNDVNIGIAVDSEKGLLVPVLKNVDRQDLPSLQNEFNDLTARALDGKSKLDDLQGGTFTITNLGSFEIEQFMPIINYPECAILGIGAIGKKPVVVNDQIVIRPRISLTLAFDHRLVDGAPAAKFLQRLKHLVEQPDFS